MDRACDTCGAARDLDLMNDLVWVPVFLLVSNPVCIDSRPEMALLDILLRPPLQQRGKALRRLCNSPIQLRAEVVQPATLQP